MIFVIVLVSEQPKVSSALSCATRAKSLHAEAIQKFPFASGFPSPEHNGHSMLSPGVPARQV